MKFYKKIVTAFKIILVIWIAGAWIAFGAGAIATFIDFPESIELPWSDFQDFVEAANGDLYVDIAFYSCVLRYDHEGIFIASYPARGKSRKLAADTNGLIHFKSINTVASYDKNWNPVWHSEKSVNDNGSWLLGRDGKPVYSPQLKNDNVPSGLVKPGEVLFADNYPLRTFFECQDGTLLKLDGNSVVRMSKTGEMLVRYSTPWYLSWLVFPWPAAFVGWGIPILLGLYVFWSSRKSKRKRAGQIYKDA
jgi:hypothetical protein